MSDLFVSVQWKVYVLSNETNVFSYILQGQTSGFHTLISLLNSCKDLVFLIFWGTMAHILGPRNLADWGIYIFGVL